MRIILHIDFDSFFASVEQQLKPELRGKPIGVTATNGRTCIIASSREAKKLGIKTGDRTWESLPKCPELVLVSADFNKYYDISKKFLKICNNYSPFVEMFSLDEVFMDITASVHLFGSVQNLIKELKAKIALQIGEYITVSVGISHNKLLAKLASGINKPNGIFKITPKNLDEIFDKAKLIDICGIGERIKLRLNQIGIYTLMDLRKTQILKLESEFGKVEAEFLKNVGLGIDDSPVTPYTEAPETKSVGRNYCLPKNEYQKKVVMQNLYELCEEIGIKLRRLNKKGRTVGIYLGGTNSVHKRKTYSEFIDKGEDIYNACYRLFKNEIFKSNNDYVRQISVWVSSLEDKENLTPSLFNETKKSNLTFTIDKINDRFGDHTIRNGFLLYAKKLTTVPNGYGADTYEKTKLANEDFSSEKQ